MVKYNFVKKCVTYLNNGLFLIMSLLLLVIEPQIHNHFRDVLPPFSFNQHVSNFCVGDVIEFFGLMAESRHGFERSWRVDEISVGDAVLRQIQVDVKD